MIGTIKSLFITTKNTQAAISNRTSIIKSALFTAIMATTDESNKKNKIFFLIFILKYFLLFGLDIYLMKSMAKSWQIYGRWEECALKA